MVNVLQSSQARADRLSASYARLTSARRPLICCRRRSCRLRTKMRVDVVVSGREGPDTLSLIRYPGHVLVGKGDSPLLTR
jgi:hypothetical protein